ncbi:MAG: hypothetical protein R2819_09200 [Allomuricauda sp.]
MKRYLLFMLFLTAFMARGEYISLKISELILESDKIVQGQIICVDENVVEIEVQESIGHTSSNLTISKYRNWAFGKRWAAYEVGQTSVFFLHYMDNELSTLGRENEGEMPVHDNKVYMYTSAISSFGITDDFNRSDRMMEDDGFNNPYNGYTVDLPLFWEAIKIFASCFQCNMNIFGKLTDVHLTCETTDFEESVKKNSLLNWAYRQLKI